MHKAYAFIKNNHAKKTSSLSKLSLLGVKLCLTCR